MINNSELRIGNWALYPHTIHEPFQITEPRHIELAYLLKPIPLTPEILEACGFEKDGFNAYNISISAWPDTHLKQLSFAGDYLYLREGDLRVNRIKDNICVLWNNDLSDKMHLHQLQNLYFALTGTELSVNLEKVKV